MTTNDENGYQYIWETLIIFLLVIGIGLGVAWGIPTLLQAAGVGP